MNAIVDRDFPVSSPGARQPGLAQTLTLLVTSSLTVMVTAVVGPSLPTMQAHFRDVPGADALVPLTMSAPLLMMALLSVAVGELADRWGRKRLLVASAIAYGIVGTMPLYLDSLAAILASRVGLGAFEAVLTTVGATLIGDYFAGLQRERYMALQTTVGAVAAVVLAVIGGALAQWGWRVPYAMFGASLALAPLLALLLWEPPSRATMTLAQQIEDSQSFSGHALAWRCVLGFLLGFEFLILNVHFGYLQAAVGVDSTALIGLAYALNSVGAIAGTLLFGWHLASAVSVPTCLGLGALLGGGSLMVMPFTTTYATLTAAGVVTGIGMGILFPAMANWNMRELPVSRRGVGTGAYNSCLAFGMFVSPVAVVGLETLIGGSRVRAVAVGGWALLAAGLAALGVGLSRQPHR